jgi:hypothetical protein
MSLIVLMEAMPIAYCLHKAGRISKFIQQYFGLSLSDSALSQRLQQLGPIILTFIMEEKLSPLAYNALFHRHLRYGGR